MLAVPPPVSLVIVGYPDPNFREYLPALIAELGLRSRVRLVPSVGEEWLPAVYRAASAFALPSLAEGYGLPALEAMAAGIPVVASAIGVLEEVWLRRGSPGATTRSCGLGVGAEPAARRRPIGRRPGLAWCRCRRRGDVAARRPGAERTAGVGGLIRQPAVA
jgi:glycosyltransferase involved in cell wall biosynthesis